MKFPNYGGLAHARGPAQHHLIWGCQLTAPFIMEPATPITIHLDAAGGIHRRAGRMDDGVSLLHRIQDRGVDGGEWALQPPGSVPGLGVWTLFPDWGRMDQAGFSDWGPSPRRGRKGPSIFQTHRQNGTDQIPVFQTTGQFNERSLVPCIIYPHLNHRIHETVTIFSNHRCRLFSIASRPRRD